MQCGGGGGGGGLMRGQEYMRLHLCLREIVLLCAVGNSFGVSSCRTSIRQ